MKPLFHKLVEISPEIPLVRILIADDHELVRAGLVWIINHQRPAWEIVAQATDGIQAAQLAAELRPSILLLDLDLPGQDGLCVLNSLAHCSLDVRVIVLSMHSGEVVARRLRAAGARGFVNKSDAPRLIVKAIEEVLQTDDFFFSERAQWGRAESPNANVPAKYALSKREMDVFRLLASGKVNKEIATELDISVRTVETHRASILNKLPANSLGDLVAIAVRENVI